MKKEIRDIVLGLVGEADLDLKPQLWQDKSAIAALLFMVMPVDGEIHDKELQRLARILEDEFDINESESAKLIAEARHHVEQPGEMDALTSRLCGTMSVAQRLTLISHMWEMVFADGRLHEFELLMVERVAKLLDLEPEQVCAVMGPDKDTSVSPN